jgi:ferredoxin
MPGKIVVDGDRCTGLGMCEVQDDGVVRVLVESVDDERVALAKKAVESCPTRALKLEWPAAG